MNNVNPILFHYNLDENGKPKSIDINGEQNQISPIHYSVQLKQRPDEENNLVVIDDLNNTLSQVEDMEDITENTYYVDYHNALVYFHRSKAGKTFIFNYWGVGYELIGASRVYDEHDVSGQTIRKTLQEIIDKGRECIDALNTIGNAIELLKRIENYIIVATELDKALKEDIKVGNQLHIDLTNDISTGSTLHKNLTNDITVGDKLHNNLTNDISTGTTLDTNLKASITEGNTTKSELDKSRLEAQNDIATIKATGNGTWTIPSSAWVGTEPNLTCVINHKMNSKNLLVGVVDTVTQKSVMNDYEIVDMNNIKMLSMEASNITVTINSQYYSGKDANIIAQEVIDARGVEVDLKSRLDKNDAQLEENTNDMIACKNENNLIDVISKCKLENKTFYVGNGIFNVNEDLTIDGIKNIKIDGTIKVAEGKTLTIRADGTTKGHIFNINTIDGTLKILGVKNGTVSIQNVKKLIIGTDSTSDSIAYSTFNLGRIDDLNITCHLGGWINDNVFIGGRIIKSFLIDGEYHINNNIFYKLCLETSTVTLTMLKGKFNYFYDVRLENNPTIVFGEGTYGNKIYKTWNSNYATAYSTLNKFNYTDNGDNNLVIEQSLEGFNVDDIVNINYYTDNLGTLVTKDETTMKLKNETFKKIFSTDFIKLPNENFGLDFKSDKIDWHIQIYFYDANKVLLEDSTLIYSPTVTWSPTNKRFNTGTKQSESRMRFNVKNKTAKYFKVDIIGYEIQWDYLNIKSIYKKGVYLEYLKDAFKVK